MRIIAGKWRGRRIDAPADERVRPTGDRVREAWMSIVSPWLPGARVVDLFAGSGALGLEALSRGAESIDLVEIAPRSLSAITTNADRLGAADDITLHRVDALRFIEKLEPHAYDVAFADPPYGMGLAERVAELWLEKPFADILGIEHTARERLPGGGDIRAYGSAAITFFGLDA
ncbi:MAG TPA: RsmD family RNA methyltransferase [Gemmatimonadaceae bacterium]|nr:RsmD family RNA methyltransferase [Gemmatimonadaceae bacterium]